MNDSAQRRANDDARAAWFDLSVVSDPLVEKALSVSLTDWRMRKRWHDLPCAHRCLHRAILRCYLDTGAAPPRDDLALRLGSAVGVGLKDLAERDLVIVERGEVVGAYPFTSRPSRHAVEIDGREIAAMCAIDALGAGAMARRDARVRSYCSQCEKPISVEIAGLGLTIAAVSPQSTVVWVGVTPVSGCAADTQCQSMLFFCDQKHLKDWRASNAPAGEGHSLTPTQAVQFGAAIFRPFMAESKQEERG